MPQIKFTSHLRRFYPTLKETEVTGKTMAEIIAALENRHPGLTNYLVDDQGALRQHVNVFIGHSLIRDRRNLQDPVAADEEIFIFQALPVR